MPQGSNIGVSVPIAIRGSNLGVVVPTRPAQGSNIGVVTTIIVNAASNIGVSVPTTYVRPPQGSGYWRAGFEENFSGGFE